MKKLVCALFALLYGATSAAFAAPGGDGPHMPTARLLGLWSCTGVDGRSDPVSAHLRFFHSSDGALHFKLRAEDNTFVHPMLAETWVYHDDKQTKYHGWETTADEGAWDRVTFTTQGFDGKSIVWTRASPAAHVTHTLAFTGPDRMSFVQQNGTPPRAQHVYALSCRRTQSGEPGPG